MTLENSNDVARKPIGIFLVDSFVLNVNKPNAKRTDNLMIQNVTLLIIQSLAQSLIRFYNYLANYVYFAPGRGDESTINHLKLPR